MDLIGMLAHRRFERERSRRAAALREAWEASFAAPEPEPRSPGIHELESTPPLAPSAPKPRGGWECEFCGRGFHGYGSYLNHRCDRHA